MSGPSLTQIPPPEVTEEKVKAVLEAVGVTDLSKLSRADAIIAMGRLLSIRARRDSSVHEVTKEVRRALELALESPLKEDVDSLVKTAIYTSPPPSFRSPALIEAYRRILAELIRRTLETSKRLSPMWRKRLINLIVENIYQVAVSEREYRERIFGVLKGEEAEGETE